MSQARDALTDKLEALRAERAAVDARLHLNGLRDGDRLERQRLKRLNLDIASLEADLAELDQFSLAGDGHPRFPDAA